MLSEPGKQYAAYILHGQRATVALPLPDGQYEVSWIDPASGKALSTETIKHTRNKKASADYTIQSPAYEFDIALRIVRKGK